MYRISSVSTMASFSMTTDDDYLIIETTSPINKNEEEENVIINEEEDIIIEEEKTNETTKLNAFVVSINVFSKKTNAFNFVWILFIPKYYYYFDYF